MTQSTGMIVLGVLLCIAGISQIMSHLEKGSPGKTFGQWVETGEQDSHWYGKGQWCEMHIEYDDGRMTKTIRCVPWRGV